MPNRPGAAPAISRHNLFDDAQALITGTLFVSIALAFFGQAGLMTGGTVGIALLAHYALGLTFGPTLFVVNLPFYVLAWRRMGARFTLKTVAAVGLLAPLSGALPQWLTLAHVHPAFAAICGGLMVGTGFIILFRHRASLGGLNVLALWAQEKRGWKAGHVLLAIDTLVLLSSLPWIGPQRLAWSILAAVAMNFALIVNHKPGRYVAF